MQSSAATAERLVMTEPWRAPPMRQFRSPVIYSLIVAAVVTSALDEYVDAAVIAAGLVFNAVVGLFQEYRAERSLEALRRWRRISPRWPRSRLGHPGPGIAPR